MSYATATSVTLIGITGHLVPVAAEPAEGRPGGIVILGPDGRSLEQTRDRVYAAIANSGLPLPPHRVTISLPRSDQPPPGSAMDLAMAAAILTTGGAFAPTALDAVVLVGELGLDGSVRPVRGVLPMVATAAGAGLTTVVVPAANTHEAQLVTGVQVIGVDSLQQFVRWATDGVQPPAPRHEEGPSRGMVDAVVGDLADLPATMSKARWALEVAAAGGHHLGLAGPPGSGTTMLAQRLRSLLPDLDDTAAWEVTAVRSAAGLLPPGAALVRRPPFQAPHHSASLAALLGGGPRASYPGSVSLAHHGVFYLDDAAQFDHRALAALGHPVDDGRVTLAGAGRTVTYPSRVQMVLGAHPYPRTEPTQGGSRRGHRRQERARYMQRIFELWRRTDIRLRLSLPDPHDTAAGESSAVVAQRVARARAIAADRWAAVGYHVNAEIPGDVLRSGACQLPTRDTAGLLRLLQVGAVGEDGYDRILRVAWSISDLHGADRPDADHITAAIELYLDRQP